MKRKRKERKKRKSRSPFPGGTQGAEALRPAGWTRHRGRGRLKVYAGQDLCSWSPKKRKETLGRKEKKWDCTMQVGLMTFCQWGKKSFWPTDFRKQLVMYHCKSWMHPKKVELQNIKVKIHKYFHPPANLDSLLGSRQDEGANRVTAEWAKRKNEGTPL